MVSPRIHFDWLLNKRTKHDVRVEEKEGVWYFIHSDLGYFLIEHLLVVRVYSNNVSWHEVYGLMDASLSTSGTGH